MNVQVNIKAATTRVKSFLSSHGGSAKHSEVLELVAGMCGFDSYRAMKAVSAKEEYSGVRLSVAPGPDGLRPLEDENRVVHRSTAVDWQLAGNPNISLDIVPQELRRKYDVVVEEYEQQFRVLLKPVGVGLDNFDGTPVLDMLVEISEGVPCVHITNDPADGMLVSVFATEQGLLVRPGDGEWMSAASERVPAVLLELAKEACGEKYVKDSYVAVLDTAEKYRDDQPEVEASTPASYVEAAMARIRQKFPQVHCIVAGPVSRKLVGSKVAVDFGWGNSSEPLAVLVSLIDGEGIAGDEDFVQAMSHFPEDVDYSALEPMARKLAELVAFFTSADYSMGTLRPMIVSVVESSEPDHFVQELLDIAFAADDKYKAFDEITRKVVA
jgi:hypothetical protein